jgi:hypothetical protein
MVKLIPLTQGQFTIVDDEDYDLLIQYKWCAHKCSSVKHRHKFYVDRANGMIMHRIILDAKVGECVDHINGDGLDNRRCNLRVCKKKENSHNYSIPHTNTSGYKGVSLDKRVGKWKCYIQVNGKWKWLGQFESKIEAALVYDQKAMELFDEYAKLNFPEYV